MSNRRRARLAQTISQWDALDGARIPGGCDSCDAYRTVHVIAPAVTQIRGHHDD
jgi:hypothetical protein